MGLNHKAAIVFLGIFVLIVISILTFLYFTRDQSLAKLQQEGVIKIGYAVEAPYAFLLHGGIVTGESPEVARVVTEKLGICRIEWHLVEFGSLIPELESHNIDVIAAGMFINPERARLVTFSRPTFHVKQGLLVPVGNPKNLHSYEQAAGTKGVKVAIIRGSVEEKYLWKAGFFEGRLVYVPDALSGKAAVETNLADALALSSPTIHWMEINDKLGDIESACPFDQPTNAGNEPGGCGAFAFRKEDKQLLKAWNSVLDTFIGSKEHMQLISKFGFTRDELPAHCITDKQKP